MLNRVVQGTDKTDRRRNDDAARVIPPRRRIRRQDTRDWENV